MADLRHNFYAMIKNSNNYLLVKDDIGKSKPTTRTLPPNEFTYGKKVGEDDEGAGKLVSSWKVHNPSQDLPNDRDFKKLNAMSVTGGFTKASDQRTFRKTMDARIQLTSGRRPKDKEIPDIVFGQPNRPSTPINAVLENYFGEVAVDIKHQEYSYNPNIKKKSWQPRSTKGFDKMVAAIRNSQEIAQKSEFKMKKFQNVKSRTDHIRTKRPVSQGV